MGVRKPPTSEMVRILRACRERRLVLVRKTYRWHILGAKHPVARDRKLCVSRGLIDPWPLTGFAELTERGRQALAEAERDSGQTTGTDAASTSNGA